MGGCLRNSCSKIPFADRQAALTGAAIETHAWQVMGDAEAAIARAIEQHATDLLIMGAYTHSPLRNLFAGSRTSDLLRAARVPTLLLR